MALGLPRSRPRDPGNPYRLLAELLQLARDARRHKASIAIEDALEGPLEYRWRALEQRARATVEGQPS
jgi:hypothetical protein